MSNGHSEFWTNFKCAQLRRFWRTDLASSEIARRLGCTKNAACGKARRMGLPPKPSVISSTSKRAFNFRSAAGRRGAERRYARLHVKLEASR